MDLVVFVNPNPNTSHGAALLNHVVNGLKKKGKSYEVVDLYKENFDPVLRYDKQDPKVAHYQNLLKKADRYIFIYPIWWFTTPAILKGFVDKVFAQDFAFNFNKDGSVIGHLKGKKAIVINTVGGPKEEVAMCNDAMANTFHNGVLGFCGVGPITRIDWFGARTPNEMVPADVIKQIDAAL